MKNRGAAFITAFLITAIAEGPWAFAQPRIVPIQPTPQPAAGPAKAKEPPAKPPKPPAPGRPAPVARPAVVAAKPVKAGPGGKPAAVAAKPIAGRAAPVAETPVVTVPAPGSGIVELPGEKEFNQCKKLPPGKRIVKVNLKPDSEISDLIAWIMASSCTPFLIASTTPLANKKITIMSPELITPEEAYRIFISALEAHSLTVEPSGRFLRIVDASRARFFDLPVYRDGDRPGVSDKRFVTRLFRFENLDATEVLNNLYNTSLRGEQGYGIAFQGTLIVTDTSLMLDRFDRITHELDVPSVVKEKIWSVRVKNMSASEMASRLAEVFQVQQIGVGGRRPGGPGGAIAAPPPAPKPVGPKGNPAELSSQLVITKLIPDERTNHLIVMANERAYEWLLTILKRLDMPIEGGGDGRVHIYYCEHANCDELAATLSAVTGVNVAGGGSNRRARAGQTAAPAAPMATPAGQQGQQSLLFEGEVRVAFDSPTNALLVFSSLKDFQSLRKVVEKLDSPRKQVYVEAMVMEVLLDKSREVGVAYHGGVPNVGGAKDVLLLGGFNASKTLSPAGLVTDLGGLSGALFGPLLNQATSRIFGTNLDIPSFGAFVKLLQKNNDVNVLQLPSLLIMNNQEGEFSVGQNLPFPGSVGLGGLGGLGGAAGGALGGLGGFGLSVQRQDVALKIKLIPSVNEHSMIRLDVDVEISDVASPNYNGMGPATSKRTVKTQIVCRDQQTVVTSGIIADRQSESVEKIPVLGDIPLLGVLFRSKKSNMQKTNILIAITPYVISDVADLQRVAEKKMRERREFMERESSFTDQYKMEANVDYRRKRGMLEEMNRFAGEIDEEEGELRRIRERDAIDEHSPIEPPPRKGEKADRPSADNNRRGLNTRPDAVPAARFARQGAPVVAPTNEPGGLLPSDPPAEVKPSNPATPAPAIP